MTDADAPVPAAAPHYWAARVQDMVGAPRVSPVNYEQFVKVRADADPPDPLVAEARHQLGQ